MYSVATDPGSETLGCGEGEDFVGGVGTEFVGPEVGGGRLYCTFFGGKDLVCSEEGVVGGWMEKGLGLGNDVRLRDNKSGGREEVW